MNQDRALIFNPYLATLGGGERYTFALAQALLPRFDVTVGGPELPTMQLLRERGFPTDLRVERMSRRDYSRLSGQFQLGIVVTNVFPPNSDAGTSVLMVQFPFMSLPPPAVPWARRAILHRLEQWTCIVYSKYTQHWLRKRWLQESVVVAPPIELGGFDPLVKRPLISSVGRFFPHEHSKRQDVLIRAYSDLPADVRAEWQLVLAGGVARRRQDQRFLRRLQTLAIKVPGVEIRPNISQAELDTLYSQSQIYWHAAGYGRSQHKPGNAEHFGMTTVEAMSYGAVPIVYADGGQTEMVNRAVGRDWRTLEELVAHTVELVNHAEQRSELARAAAGAARAYGVGAFNDRILDFLLSAASRRQEEVE